MKLLKYIKDDNNYCLVQKTRLYIHFLLCKENKYHYYFTFNLKNYNKTNKICNKFLKSNNLKVELKNHNSFDLMNQYNNYVNKTDYNIIISIYGEENFDIVKIYQGEKELVSFKEINKSPTFIYGYVFHIFGYKYSATYHGALIEKYVNYYKRHSNDKIHNLIIRYYKYLINHFIKYNFNLRSNFELLEYCDVTFKNKYYMFLYLKLDQIIKLNVNKILNKFKISTDEEKFGYIYFYNNYLYDFYYQYYLKFISDKNKKISFTSCGFNTPLIYNKTKDILNYNNLILTKLNFKKYILFFTEKHLNQYLNLVNEKTILKKNEIKIKKYLDIYVK